MAQRKWKWKQDIIKFNAYTLRAIFFLRKTVSHNYCYVITEMYILSIKQKRKYFFDDVSKIYSLPRRKHRTERNIERLSLCGGGGRPRDGSRSFQFIAHGWILPSLHAFIPCFNQLVSTIMILSHMFLGIWGNHQKTERNVCKELRRRIGGEGGSWDAVLDFWKVSERATPFAFMSSLMSFKQMEQSYQVDFVFLGGAYFEKKGYTP